MNSMRLVKKWVSTPPAQWNDFIRYTAWKPRRTESFQEVRAHLEDTALRYLLLAQYLETRIGLDGCGEKSHEEGVKEANKRQAKIRQAMGFTYPERDIFKF